MLSLLADARSVGLYQPAVRVGAALIILPDAVATVLLGRLARAPEDRAVKRHQEQLLTVGLPVGVVLTVLAALVGKRFLGLLYGHEFGQCAAGAKHGTKLMVIYGESRAPMWAAALEGVAAEHGYKLRTFYMNGCPALDLHFMSYETHAPNIECHQFHESAATAIRNLHPDLVITTSYSTQMLADGSQPTAAQWQDGWASTFPSTLIVASLPKLAALTFVGVRIVSLKFCPVLALSLCQVRTCTCPCSAAATPQ